MSWCSLERITPHACSQPTKAGGESMCAHLWNWLVRKAARHKKREDPEEIPIVRSLQGHDNPHGEHEGKARQAVVAVGVDEVVADDPFRVDVMLAEGFDEVGPDDWRVVGTEVVGEEVYEPGEEVSGQVSQDSQDRRKPQVAEVEHPLVNFHAYQQQKQHKTQNAKD